MNFPIKLKLFSITFILGLIMTALVIFSLIKIDSINDSVKRNTKNSISRVEKIFKLKEIILEINIIKKDLILSNSVRQFEDNLKELKSKRTFLYNAFSELNQSLSNKGKERISEMKLLIDDWEKQQSKIIGFANKSVRKGHKADNAEVAFKFDNKALELDEKTISPILTKIENLLEKTLEENLIQMKINNKMIQKDYESSRLWFSSLAIFGVIAGVFASFLIGQSVAKDLKRLTDYVSKINDTQDLSLKAPKLKKDEIGALATSFEEMRQTIYERDHRLLDVNKELTRKNAEIEQFVYTVSHDLKSPLVTAKGFIGFMKEDLEEGNKEGVIDSANRIASSCEHMSNIIDDLLELSRVGKDKREFTNLDTQQIVEKIVARHSTTANEKEIELLIETSLPNIDGNENDISRTFDNLIGNALKYGCDTPATKIMIGAVSSKSEHRFYVKDEGKGIPKEFHDTIFGLFKRLEKSKDGTGLGLASVEKVMKLHNGEVWVESAEGKGATFWLSFPIKT